MKRILVFVLVPSILAATVGVTLAEAGAGRVPSGDVGTSRVLDYIGHGPSSKCTPGHCTTRVIPQQPFRFRGAGPLYRATVTVSFDYRTSPAGEFVLMVWVTGPGGVTMSPKAHALSAVAAPTSTTLVFLVDGLRSNSRYMVNMQTNITQQVGVETSIHTSRMLIAVDASAA